MLNWRNPGSDYSVPYTSGPMVWHQTRVSCLELFHAVVKEKVDKDGVDICVRVLPSDLTPNELNDPDAAPW